MDVYPVHAFGIHGPIRDNVVCYKHDRTRQGIIFPVGSVLASFDPETNDMHFFERKQNHCNACITALALAPNHKFVAHAVHGSIGDGAQIHVFQTAIRRKIATMSHRSKVNTICFSSDSKWLICASDDLVAIWSWEKEKLDYSTSITGNISRISRPPLQIDTCDLMFTSTGLGHARIWVASSRHRLNNYMIMQNKIKEQKYIFTDHTWLRCSDNEEILRLVVVMEPRKKSKGPDNPNFFDSSITIYQLNEDVVSNQPSLEVEETIDISLQENVKIFSISPFTSDLSFILGCSSGNMLVYEYEQDRLGEAKFTKKQQMMMAKGNEENIIYIHVSNKENWIVVSDAMKLYTSSDRDIPHTSLHSKHGSFTPLLSLGHFGGVKAMDCSFEKPLLVSCGFDNIISIFDYYERKRLFSYQFEGDEPSTVSIHPNGHQLLVGFKDKIVLCHILIDRLKAFREMSCKGVCHQIKFAPLGHYFAAVLSNDIHIYATYTKSNSATPFHLLHCFTGHVGLVKTLTWANSSALFTSGSDKNVYGWDVQRGSRIDNLNVFRTFGEISALDVSSKGLGFEAFACTSDGSLHRVVWQGIGDIEVTNVYTRSEDVSVSLAFSEDRTMMFVGTRRGIVRCFDLDSNGKGEPSLIKELCYHSKHSGATTVRTDTISPVISLKCARKYLFTAGGIDGSLFLCKVEQISQMRSDCSQHEDGVQLYGEPVALITLEDYNQSKDLLADLEQKIVTMNNEYEYALHSKDALWKNEIKELTAKTNEIVEAEHQRFEELRQKYEDTIRMHVIDLDRKDNAHNLKIRKLELTYEERLKQEKDQTERLKNEMITKQKEFNVLYDKQKIAHEKKLEGIVREYDSIEKKLKAQIAKLEYEAKESDKIFTEILDQQEEEYEMELRNVVAKSDEMLHKESIRNQHMKGAVQNLKSKKKQLSQLNDELRSKRIVAEDAFQRELFTRNATQFELEKEKDAVFTLKSQIKMKDSDVKKLEADKKSLTNLNFFLETKIKELQEEKSPLNEQLKAMNQQITDLQRQLADKNKAISNAAFELNQKEMKLQSQIRNVRSSEHLIRQLKSEFISLSGLVDDEIDRKKQLLLKEKLDAAYKKFRLSN